MLKVRSCVVEEFMPPALDIIKPEEEERVMSKLDGVAVKEDDTII